MNFCSNCGHAVVRRQPDGDTRERHVCDNCQTVHYQNPKIVCGCLPVWAGKVLLCKRSIAPREGFWTLPAGFMENGETTSEAAARETWEEACARVTPPELYAVFNIRHINQVYMMFRAELLDGSYGVGEESSDAGLFEEADIPWDQLAFPSITRTLRYFFEDRKTGVFAPRVRDLELQFRR